MENEATLNLSLGYTAFFLGVAATFLLRWFAAQRTSASDDATQTDAPQRAAKANCAGAAVSGLRDVAHNMACDVNAHRLLVEKVSTRLGATLTADTPDEKLILNSTVELLDANFELQCRLTSAEQKIDAQAQEISFREREAATDALTKLPNRRIFDARLTDCLAAFESSNKPFSVIMLDVDFFKQFNDAHGHVAGDAALRALGQKLPQLIKKSDAACRFGGEEFALILRGARVLEAQAAANRLRAAVEAMPIEVDGQSLRMTISLGVAEAMPGDDAARIISRADACVYASKRVGRNCTHWHNGTKCIFASERKAKAAGRGKSIAGRLSSLWRHRGDERVDHLPIITDRAVLVSLLQRRVAEAARSDEPLAVLLLNVPRFARMQEQVGESEAARIESQIASALAGALRDMDYIGRWRQAEYTIVLPRCTEAAAKIVAERLTTVVKSALIAEGGEAKELEPAIAVAPVMHPVTAEQVLAIARQELSKPTMPCSAFSAPEGNVE